MISTRDREFYERSLADLDRELAAGDLTEADHRRLRADYERRLRGEGPPPRPPVRRGFLAASIGFVVVVAIAAGLLVAQAAGRRDAGDTISGEDLTDESPTTTPTAPPTSLPEDLARCTALDATEAIDCFITYTTANPDDPEGFIQFGIFSISAGMQSERGEELFSAGEEFLRRALELDPDSVVARVYLAVLLDRTDRPEEAAAACDQLASSDVPSDLSALVDLACG